MFDFFKDIFIDNSDTNPANGLPMIDSSIDIEGNIYGTDLNNDDLFSSSCFDDDLFSSNCFDDDFI